MSHTNKLIACYNIDTGRSIMSVCVTMALRSMDYGTNDVPLKSLGLSAIPVLHNEGSCTFTAVHIMTCNHLHQWSSTFFAKLPNFGKCLCKSPTSF